MVVIEYISMNTFFNDEKHKNFIIQKLFIILKRGRKIQCLILIILVKQLFNIKNKHHLKRENYITKTDSTEDINKIIVPNIRNIRI